MPDKDEKRNPVSRSIDLSTGKKGKKKVTAGMAAPVVQETINLSTPNEEEEAAPPEAKKPKGATSKKRTQKNTSSKQGTQSGGASLAELLDPETLARLKGTG